jgi:hypothetical protein
MSTLKDLEVIYLSLEEGEVLRDMGDDWSPEDTSEFGLDFQQLLEMRNFVLDQNWSENLGFRLLLQDIFPQEIRGLLTSEEVDIWTSVESNLDYTHFALAMTDLISGNLQNIKETLIDDWLVDELDSMEASKELKKLVRENFKVWKSSEAPNALLELLPTLAKRELSKLQDLRK